MIDRNPISEESIRYISEGKGKPLILLHGFGASNHDWKFLLPKLSKAGYHAFAPDLLGHGESAKPKEPEAYTFGRLYQSLENWITGLEIEEPILIVGHSMGGLLALKYSHDHQDRVNSLVLIDPYVNSKQLSPWMRFANQNHEMGKKALQAAPGWLIESLVGLEFKKPTQYNSDVRRQIAQDYKRASPNILRFFATIPNLDSLLQNIEAAVLVLWGSRDLTLDPASFPNIVQSLPNAKGHEIPECGHQPHLARPDIVIEAILDFFEQTAVLTRTRGE
jgi:pimeloyl-ACP methyl ester carboxylesterase